MKKFVGMLVIAMMAMPAMAGTITTPHAAGDFNGWSASADPMTETFVGSDIWTRSITGLTPGARYEYKIADLNWSPNSIPLPGNSWLFADGAGNIDLTYDGNTYADTWSPTFDRFGQSTDGGAWTAVGSFQSQIGGGDWDNANVNTAMAPQGGGIYALTAVLTPGTYDWKAVVTGSWDAISWDCRSVNSANWSFTTDAVLDTVTFEVNGLDGTARVTVTPEPSTLALLGLGGLALLRRRR